MNKRDSMRREIAEKLQQSAQIKRAIAKSKISKIERMVNLIVMAYKRGGKVVLFGFIVAARLIFLFLGMHCRLGCGGNCYQMWAFAYE